MVGKWSGLFFVKVALMIRVIVMVTATNIIMAQVCWVKGAVPCHVGSGLAKLSRMLESVAILAQGYLAP